MQAFLGKARFFLGETLKGLVRQKSLSAATLVSTAASLLVFGIVLLVTANVQLVSAQLEQRKGIVAFIEEGVSDGQLRYLKTEIEKLGEVESVRHVSKEEALEQFRKSLGSEEVLEALNSNPLPASFEVTLRPGQRGANELETVASFIGGLKGIEEVSFGGAWALRLDKLLKNLTILNIIVGVIVGLAVAFVVANVVRLTVLARRDGIAIMKIVGATAHFVRIPFILEGLLLTLVSSLATLVVLYAGHKALAGRLPDVVFLTPRLVVLFIAVGVGSGVLGAYLTLSEVLRERRS